MRQPLGQHFLRDLNVVRTIVAAADLSPTDTALEIGPGRGVLTDAVAPAVGSLVVVELDRTLAAKLQARESPSFKVVQGDVLKVDFDALFPKATQPIKVLGNLPYSITSPIFEKLLAWPGWKTGVFLIQREVAERMKAGPGSKTFGVLSLAIQAFADVETILKVKPGAFSPPPEVMSMVIRLRRRATPVLPEAELPDFFDLVHGAFAHRRKTVANSVALHSQISKEEVSEWFREQAIDPQRRAETLGLEDFARMAHPWAIFRRKSRLTST